MRDMNVNYFQLPQRQHICSVNPVMEAILRCLPHNLRAPLILIVKVYTIVNVMITIILSCVPNRQVFIPPAKAHVFTLTVNTL